MFCYMRLFFCFFFFFFKQKTAYEMLRSLVGSEMCIRDRHSTHISPHRFEHCVSECPQRNYPRSAGHRATLRSLPWPWAAFISLHMLCFVLPSPLSSQLEHLGESGF
eukprot:TRINITY_DN2188_c0_g1_i7.p1 TRINITY_DN2188_c0_g1~~TRINITY_DN2188_c0_g1_i7.p1  ORF type:complete len:107 (+),score=18.11 TRINITY_DN2188_c0_g1_i7:56-376(+)